MTATTKGFSYLETKCKKSYTYTEREKLEEDIISKSMTNILLK